MTGKNIHIYRAPGYQYGELNNKEIPKVLLRALMQRELPNYIVSRLGLKQPFYPILMSRTNGNPKNHILEF